MGGVVAERRRGGVRRVGGAAACRAATRARHASRTAQVTHIHTQTRVAMPVLILDNP